MAKIEGLKELEQKLLEMEYKTAGKTLRNAVATAVNPAMKAIRLAVPVGKKAHRTYKGRLVAPGHLKRSIRKRSRFKGKKAWVTIGVKSEAFYGVQFLDEKGTKKASPKHWFKSKFESKQHEMELRFRDQLRLRIERIARK